MTTDVLYCKHGQILLLKINSITIFTVNTVVNVFLDAKAKLGYKGINIIYAFFNLPNT